MDKWNHNADVMYCTIWSDIDKTSEVSGSREASR